MEKQLQTINQFLGTNFTTMQDALLIVESLKTSNVEKYTHLQLLLHDEPEQGEKAVLPEAVKVNQAKWTKSVMNSNSKKGFKTLTGLAKELEGLNNFSMFNVTGTEARVINPNTYDTKIDNYLELAFIYDGKLVKAKIPVSKLQDVEHEVLQGLPFQFATCEFVETTIDGAEVQYIKYSFSSI